MLTYILAALPLRSLLGHLVVNERGLVVGHLAGAGLISRGPEVVAAVGHAKLVAVGAEDD